MLLNLDLKIESKTKQSIIHAVNNLDQISFERKRDELFKILENHNSFSAILLLQKFGVLDHLGCEPTFERMDQLRTYELLQEIVLPAGKKTGTDYFIAGYLLIRDVFNQEKTLHIYDREKFEWAHAVPVGQICFTYFQRIGCEGIRFAFFGCIFQ